MNVATLSGTLLRDTIELGASTNGKTYLTFKAEITRSRGKDVLNFVVWEPFDKIFYHDFCLADNMKIQLQCSIRAMGDRVIMRVEQYEFEERRDNNLSDNMIKRFAEELKKKCNYKNVLKRLVARTGDQYADRLGETIIVGLVRLSCKNDFISNKIKIFDELQLSCLLNRFYDGSLKQRQIKNIEPYLYQCIKTLGGDDINESL